MAASYEDTRRKRLEENRKRMEELNLLKLSRSLKPSLEKVVKPKLPRKAVDVVVLTDVRRSTRVADKPQPDYREVSCRRDFSKRKVVPKDLREKAIARAESVERELGSKFPTFVRPILHSHTAGCLLGLPSNFCSDYMPKKDEFFILEDEEGNKWQCTYLGKWNALSAGWTGFASEYELVVGDSLVFQLVNPTKFMVYIIRHNECRSEDEDGDDEKENAVELLHSVSEVELEEVAEPSPGKRRSMRKRSGMPIAHFTNRIPNVCNQSNTLQHS